MNNEIRKFKVVQNDEGQYSIWLDTRVLPLGWQDTGVVGTKEECLLHIEKIWKDILPLSIRQPIR
ncbi:MbtH family protein [Acinetobacter pittii]|uniref:MbtH family protein n=1 Tax=Acinetobacter pittii TaxID=48296 RepID=UPI0021D2AA29|nr:MbtH family protein [Acinetobacter pittii]MCU4528179.1 MbtH family protein [Acinetobacter pittii]